MTGYDRSLVQAPCRVHLVFRPVLRYIPTPVFLGGVQIQADGYQPVDQLFQDYKESCLPRLGTPSPIPIRLKWNAGTEAWHR